MDPKQHPSVAASDTASAEPRLSALLKPAQASALTSTLVVLEKTLGEIERLCIGANCGELAGQTIFHAHIHLIPRRAGDNARPRGGVRGVIPDRMGY